MFILLYQMIETNLPLSFKESTKLYVAYIMTAGRQSAYVIN